MSESRTKDIQTSSTRLKRFVTTLCVSLSILLVLERFGAIALSLAQQGLGDETLRRLSFQVVNACPEVLYLVSLWWIRQSLASFARGEFYAPTITRMLQRVGTLLAIGAAFGVFVLPSLDRALGFAPGYWVAFDVSGLVLGAIGLSLTIVARVLERAHGLQAELNEIF